MLYKFKLKSKTTHTQLNTFWTRPLSDGVCIHLHFLMYARCIHTSLDKDLGQNVVNCVHTFRFEFKLRQKLYLLTLWEQVKWFGCLRSIIYSKLTPNFCRLANLFMKTQQFTLCTLSCSYTISERIYLNVRFIRHTHTHTHTHAHTHVWSECQPY